MLHQKSHFRNCGIERRCVCTQMVRIHTRANAQSDDGSVVWNRYEKQNTSRGVNFCRMTVEPNGSEMPLRSP